MANDGIVVTGCIAKYCGVTYEFRNNEDADGFKQCCENGGRPGVCADKFHCISKTTEVEEPSIGGPSL